MYLFEYIIYFKYRGKQNENERKYDKGARYAFEKKNIGAVDGCPYNLRIERATAGCNLHGSE